MEFLAAFVSYTSAIIGGAFAIFAFINGGLNRRSIFMAIAMGSLATWAASIAMMYGETDEAAIMRLAVVCYASTCLATYGLLMMSLSFAKISNRHFWALSVVSFVPALCLVVAMLINSETMFLGAEFTETGFLRALLQNPVGYALFGVQITAYTALSFAIIRWSIKTCTTAAGRKSLRFFFAGGAMVGTFAFTFNLIIPMFLYDYTLIWVGPIGIIGYAITSYSAVVKFAQDEL